MPTRPEPINAIGYAQFHLKGGAKNMLLTAVGVLLLFGIVAMSVYAVDPRHFRSNTRGLVYMLLFVQWLVLCFFGGSRVVAAVRQDITTGLIESHRLTPTPPLAAVLGYVLGAPVQALVIGVVVLLCGIATTLTANLPVSFWLVGNVMALGAAAMLWTLAAVVTFSTRQVAVVPVAAIVSTTLSSVLIIVPAVTVLVAPVFGQSLWSLSSLSNMPPAYPFTLVANALLAGVFLLGAARRYRSVVTDAFSPLLGLLLLTIWSAITAIGLVLPDTFWDSRMIGRLPGNEQVRLIAGLCASMLVALLPVGALARAAVLPPEMAEGGRPASRPLAWLGLPLCAALVWSAAGMQLTDNWNAVAERQWGTAAVIFLTLAGVAFWVAAADLRGRTGWISAFSWLALINVVPLAAAAMVDPERMFRDQQPSSIPTVSPVAALAMLWSKTPDVALLGIITQAGLLLIPLLFLVVRLRRGRPDAASNGLTTDASSPQNALLPRA